MAQQEEPLYDFPEPTQSSVKKVLGHHRGRGSLRSISVLDRLLLTVPVWLQLSINPATALHILQREPPGTFLVRKSRTSQKNVLCVRLEDDSIPSFVQQFGIVEEPSALCLETSAISFPDLPRLIAFYCVSRDVLPFPLELPDAIAKASSHKELESISHMGIEFWNSHLNVRGPRETPKSQKDVEKKPDGDGVTSTSSSSAVPPNTSSGSTSQTGSEKQNTTEPDSDKITIKPTLFHEFCPITTRSPRELDCGSGLGAFCFINPLFLQSHNVLSRRRFLKRSLKVRVSTESSTLLSPPLAPPPPPPLMPKIKRKCKPQEQQEQDGTQSTAQETPAEVHTEAPSVAPPEEQTQPQGEEDELEVPLPIILEHLPDDADYMQPPAIGNPFLPRPLSPYLSPAVASIAPPISPKGTPPLSPARSPGASPSLSPYQSPSLSPRIPIFLSLQDSPNTSPYQSPCPSPKPLFSLSPITFSPLSQMAEQNYQTPTVLQKSEQDTPGGEVNEREEEEEEEEQQQVNVDDGMENGAAAAEDCEVIEKEEEEDKKIGQIEKEELEARGLVLQMNAAALNETDCSSSHELEGAAEIVPPSSQGNAE